jgi:glycosyltransferase involved in cell wall biosynthesis
VKIGILGHDFMNWTGGVDFLWLVTDCLLACPRAKTTEFHLLVPDANPVSTWARWRTLLFPKKSLPVSAVASDVLCSAFLGFGSRVPIHHIGVGPNAVHRVATRLGLEIVLPAVHSLGADFPLPWLAYAYDFQHKYFPENFTPEVCQSRDKHFAELLTQARAVIVNSRAAAGDIARYVPQASARVFALPFAPAPRPDWLEDRPEILARYKVTQPYFMISNQFWTHKNHVTAFEAFRLIAAANPTLNLVCTGLTTGSTDAAYFPGLLAFLEKTGLKNRIQILGLIPKRDQIELMKHACAVIQPTLFEGGPGGGAVYDAVSLGVPAIVSDIPVNRELPEGSLGLTFFPVRDAAVLADRMQMQLSAPRRKIPRDDLVSAGKRYRAACGQVLWDATDFVL